MKYFLRSLKYFVALCVLCVVMMALMLATGTSALTLDQTIEVAFHSDRYLMLAIAIVVLSALYPRFGFVVRDVEGDLKTSEQQVVNAFKAGGFALVGQTSGATPTEEADDAMVFRAKGLFLKIRMLFEDKITVSQHGPWIRLDGNRRGVARVQYRLESYLRMNRYE